MTDKKFITITVPLSRIRPGHIQFRRTTGFDAQEFNDFALSVKQHGIINPPLVYQQGDLYPLHAGERRWRARCLIALEEAGLYTWEKALQLVIGPTAREDLIKLGHLFDDVRIEVRMSLSGPSLGLSIIENGQRANLKPSEDADGYQSLAAEGFSIADIAQMANKPEAAIQALVLSAQLEPEIRELIDQDRLPKGLDLVKALLSVADSKARVGIAQRVAAFEKGRVNKSDLVHNLCRSYLRSLNSAAPVANRSNDDPTSEGHASENGMAAGAGTNGHAVVSIDQVKVTYLYTPPPHRFDQLCLGCTSVILALAEECCNECLVNGFTAECLECEGFLAFARLLIQELNHRPMAFDQEASSDQVVARQSELKRGTKRGDKKEDSLSRNV